MNTLGDKNLSDIAPEGEVAFENHKVDIID